MLLALTHLPLHDYMWTNNTTVKLLGSILHSHCLPDLTVQCSCVCVCPPAEKHNFHCKTFSYGAQLKWYHRQNSGFYKINVNLWLIAHANSLSFCLNQWLFYIWPTDWPTYFWLLGLLFEPGHQFLQHLDICGDPALYLTFLMFFVEKSSLFHQFPHVTAECTYSIGQH